MVSLDQRLQDCLDLMPSLTIECSRDELVSERFLLAADGSVSIYYAPIDQMNVKAKLVLAGVTPGRTQMRLAFRSAVNELRTGGTTEAALHVAKQQARFAGSMRSNLISMLDALEVAPRLGAGSAGDLFAGNDHLIHTTSAIRYPAFVDGRNYTGHDPAIDVHPLLCSFIDDVLAPELEALPGALIIPLGKAVDAALHRLTTYGRLDPARWVTGFPHPSGANGHRHRQFADRREHLTDQIARWFA